MSLSFTLTHDNNVVMFTMSSGLHRRVLARWGRRLTATGATTSRGTRTQEDLVAIRAALRHPLGRRRGVHQHLLLARGQEANRRRRSRRHSNETNPS